MEAETRQIVLDTNVIVAALKSRRGASNQLLRLIGDARFRLNLSVPLLLEYEEVCRRPDLGIAASSVDAVIDFLCACAERRMVYYTWRPYLPDPQDDMVLELAVSAGKATIVTFNLNDFRGCETFGVSAMTPQAFLRELGELP